jgi:hypothetical protein
MRVGIFLIRLNFRIGPESITKGTRFLSKPTYVGGSSFLRTVLRYVLEYSPGSVALVAWSADELILTSGVLGFAAGQ